MATFGTIILFYSEGGSASGTSAAAIARDALAPLIGLDDEGSAGSDDTDEEEQSNRSCSANGIGDGAGVHGGTGGEIGTTPSMDSDPAAPPQQPALATASQEGVGPARRGGRGTGGRARLSDIFRWPLGGGGTVLTLPPAAAVVPGASPDLGGGGHFLSMSAGAMFTMDDMMAASASSAASSVNHPSHLHAAAALPQSTCLDRRPRGAGPSAFNSASGSALSQRVAGQMGDIKFDGKGWTQ